MEIAYEGVMIDLRMRSVCRLHEIVGLMIFIERILLTNTNTTTLYI